MFQIVFDSGSESDSPFVGRAKENGGAYAPIKLISRVRK